MAFGHGQPNAIREGYLVLRKSFHCKVTMGKRPDLLSRLCGVTVENLPCSALLPMYIYSEQKANFLTSLPYLSFQSFLSSHLRHPFIRSSDSSHHYLPKATLVSFVLPEPFFFTLLRLQALLALHSNCSK